jgi:hypothetical protein
MSKYTQVQNSIYSIFGTDAWNNEDIKTIPLNFTSVITEDSYIRISIITSSNEQNYGALDNVAGIISIDIFVSTGKGTARIYEIADTLDKYLAGTTVNSLQLTTSTLTPFGHDRDNTNLFRAIYSIPFSYFGAN